jgi:hypothetical protein
MKRTRHTKIKGEKTKVEEGENKRKIYKHSSSGPVESPLAKRQSVQPQSHVTENLKSSGNWFELSPKAIATHLAQSAKFELNITDSVQTGEQEHDVRLFSLDCPCRRQGQASLREDCTKFQMSGGEFLSCKNPVGGAAVSYTYVLFLNFQQICANNY